MSEEQIREILNEYYTNAEQCGFEVFLIRKEFPKLKRVLLSDDENLVGESFRTTLKNMVFDIIYTEHLLGEAEYVEGWQLADNQHKYFIVEQDDNYHPFIYLNAETDMPEFIIEDLMTATGLVFCIRKGDDIIWLYQHLWSIMIPNKKKTKLSTRIMQFENKVYFAE